MLLAVLVVLALTALPACLSQTITCLPPSFYAHVMFLDDDVDGDGHLHLREMIDTFHDYDTNHDGRVSRQEYTAHQIALDPTYASMAHALYDIFDINMDHHLEMIDYDSFYRSMDGDGDDNVSEAEFIHHWTALICHVGHHHTSFCMDMC